MPDCRCGFERQTVDDDSECQTMNNGSRHQIEKEAVALNAKL